MHKQSGTGATFPCKYCGVPLNSGILLQHLKAAHPGNAARGSRGGAGRGPGRVSGRIEQQGRGHSSGRAAFHVAPPPPPPPPQPIAFGDFERLNELQPLRSVMTAHREHLQLLQKAVAPRQLYVFGSLVQNLATRTSDIDVAVAPYADEDPKVFLKRVSQRLSKLGLRRTVEVQLVLRAHVPVIRSTERSPFQFDLSTGLLGVRNSHYVRAYVLAKGEGADGYNPVHALVTAVVQYLKSKKCHGNPNQFLSTYSVVLLVLNFLLWRGKISFIDPASVVPPLQDLVQGALDNEVDHTRPTPVPIFPDAVYIPPPPDAAKMRALLYDFVCFYWPSRGHAAQTEALGPQSKSFPTRDYVVRIAPEPWKNLVPKRGYYDGAFETALAIEDPLENGVNTSRHSSPRKLFITQRVLRQDLFVLQVDGSIPEEVEDDEDLPEDEDADEEDEDAGEEDEEDDEEEEHQERTATAKPASTSSSGVPSAPVPNNAVVDLASELRAFLAALPSHCCNYSEFVAAYAQAHHGPPPPMGELVVLLRRKEHLDTFEAKLISTNECKLSLKDHEPPAAPPVPVAIGAVAKTPRPEVVEECPVCYLVLAQHGTTWDGHLSSSALCRTFSPHH
eukprot:TRINITY_DN3204_c0_g1_i1.p1 TRINITY_DN3204_c0_g1~~TRINITY_DN3204_c0_g1_i1.p1  ORF type:complete len:616 (+),score=90.80 TRINITY_DN3204_c0_g1_i1:52-1899(+)